MVLATSRKIQGNFCSIGSYDEPLWISGDSNRALRLPRWSFALHRAFLALGGAWVLHFGYLKIAKRGLCAGPVGVCIGHKRGLSRRSRAPGTAWAISQATPSAGISFLDARKQNMAGWRGRWLLLVWVVYIEGLGAGTLRSHYEVLNGRWLSHRNKSAFPGS